MNVVRRRLAAGVGVVSALAVFGVMAVTGGAGGLQSYVKFRPAGIMAEEPRVISRVRVHARDRTVDVVRGPDHRWSLDGIGLEDALARRVDVAIGFMHDSVPIRVLTADEYDPARLADFALDAPRYALTLVVGDRPALAAEFGGLNPARSAQYVRVRGAERIALLPSFVGREWEVVTAGILAGTRAGRRGPAARLDSGREDSLR